MIDNVEVTLSISVSVSRNYTIEALISEDCMQPPPEINYGLVMVYFLLS